MYESDVAAYTAAPISPGEAANVPTKPSQTTTSTLPEMSEKSIRHGNSAERLQRSMAFLIAPRTYPVCDHFTKLPGDESSTTTAAAQSQSQVQSRTSKVLQDDMSKFGRTSACAHDGHDVRGGVPLIRNEGVARWGTEDLLRGERGLALRSSGGFVTSVAAASEKGGLKARLALSDVLDVVGGSTTGDGSQYACPYLPMTAGVSEQSPVHGGQQEWGDECEVRAISSTVHPTHGLSSSGDTFERSFGSHGDVAPASRISLADRLGSAFKMLTGGGTNDGSNGPPREGRPGPSGTKYTQHPGGYSPFEPPPNQQLKERLPDQPAFTAAAAVSARDFDDRCRVPVEDDRAHRPPKAASQSISDIGGEHRGRDAHVGASEEVPTTQGGEGGVSYSNAPPREQRNTGRTVAGSGTPEVEGRQETRNSIQVGEKTLEKDTKHTEDLLQLDSRAQEDDTQQRYQDLMQVGADTLDDEETRTTDLTQSSNQILQDRARQMGYAVPIRDGTQQNDAASQPTAEDREGTTATPETSQAGAEAGGGSAAIDDGNGGSREQQVATSVVGTAAAAARGEIDCNRPLKKAGLWELKAERNRVLQVLSEAESERDWQRMRAEEIQAQLEKAASRLQDLRVTDGCAVKELVEV